MQVSIDGDFLPDFIIKFSNNHIQLKNYDHNFTCIYFLKEVLTIKGIAIFQIKNNFL